MNKTFKQIFRVVRVIQRVPQPFTNSQTCRPVPSKPSFTISNLSRSLSPKPSFR